MVKEQFCGVCAAVPLALAGIGSTAYGSMYGDNYGSQSKTNTKTIWILVSTVMLIVSVYLFIKTSNNCDVCSIK